MVLPPRLARISTLLDEAAEELEDEHRQNPYVQVPAISKIREAQRLLITDEPQSRPEDN
jgi:hypothetical protein